jgi:outer membrane protein assembly factor BamB
MRIDASQRGRLPQVEPASPWSSPDGRHKGWSVSLPGTHPLATPAVSDGRVFLGGGFGSYEFYALDAANGSVVWGYQTEDDGPTAAVVEGNRVAFNTECCELEVLTVDGKQVWKKWLGDPLMSMPAIQEGRIFQAYPDSRGDHRHYLGCFDLDSGNEIWKQPIAGEIITAPVLADSRVHLTCLDGTLACFDQATGARVWQENALATTSPHVHQGQCYFAHRFQTEEPVEDCISEIIQNEQLVGRACADGSGATEFPATATRADYLDLHKRQRGSDYYAECELTDAAVGFAGHKGDAKMEQAGGNLGHGHVSSIWAYQGARPFGHAGRLYSSLGQTVQCLDPDSGSVVWKKSLYQTEGEVLDHVLTPPATVNGKLFMGSIRGDVFCLDARSGDVLWSVSLGEPVLFQPAVAQGRLYAPTGRGKLFCVETGDRADDGWQMWGATAAHNGLGE